jgi:hypothetical protein
MEPIGKTTQPHERRDRQIRIITVTASARPEPANNHINNTTLSHHRALPVFHRLHGARGRKDDFAVDDPSPQSRVEYLRGVAEHLRGLAAQMRYDLRRGNQILALADGFERFAQRLEQQAKISD